MEKTGISITLSNPPNTGMLTQKYLLTKQSMLQPSPSLGKIHSVIGEARNIIQSLLLSHVLLRLLDPTMNNLAVVDLAIVDFLGNDLPFAYMASYRCYKNLKSLRNQFAA